MTQGDEIERAAFPEHKVMKDKNFSSILLQQNFPKYQIA